MHLFIYVFAALVVGIYIVDGLFLLLWFIEQPLHGNVKLKVLIGIKI